MKNKYHYNYSGHDRGHNLGISRSNEYIGRTIITPDSKISNRIYYQGRQAPSEAIVVDREDHPEIYNEYIDEVFARARHPRQDRTIRGKIVESVYDTVQANMPYSQQRVTQVYQNMGGVRGQEINLSVYMGRGFGVCRHQALACAALLEMCHEGGYINGRISVDRSTRHHQSDAADYGAHAWVRYTDAGGPIILDVAQRYFGGLKESVSDRRVKWNYLRPEEETLEEYELLIAESLSITGLRRVASRPWRWSRKVRPVAA